MVDFLVAFFRFLRNLEFQSFYILFEFFVPYRLQHSTLILLTAFEVQEYTSDLGDSIKIHHLIYSLFDQLPQLLTILVPKPE